MWMTGDEYCWSWCVHQQRKLHDIQKLCMQAVSDFISMPGDAFHADLLHDPYYYGPGQRGSHAFIVTHLRLLAAPTLPPP